MHTRSFFALLSSFFTATTAAPAVLLPFSGTVHRSLDVNAPPVTAPNATTVWNAGEKQTVSWDTSALDSQGSDTGYLLLGYSNGDDNEHLDISMLIWREYCFSKSNHIREPRKPTCSRLPP